MAAPAKPQAYRPPRSTGSLAALMRAEREGSAGPAKINSSVAARMAHPNLPVGMAPPKESNAAKNRAKKEKKKKSLEAAAAAQAEMERLKLEQQTGAVASTPQEPLTEADKEKRLKKLTKTLKAIDAIKEKVAAGESINSDQKSKLETEAVVKAEIAELSSFD